MYSGVVYILGDRRCYSGDTQYKVEVLSNFSCSQ